MRERLRHLGAGLAASAVLLLVGVAVGYAFRGPVGAAGAAAGVGLVVASYTVSSAAIAWADSVDPQLVLKVGLGVYLVKFTVIGMAMAAVAASGWAGLLPMGVAIFAAVTVWSGAQIWWVTHDRAAAPRTPDAAPRTPEAAS